MAKTLAILPECYVILASCFHFATRRCNLIASDARLARSALLLYDQALLAEGSRVKDPATFAKTVNELLVKDVSA